MESLEKSKSNAPILLYIPGLHDGYMRFFSRHLDSDTLWIVGADLAGELSSLHTEIRALDPHVAKLMIGGLNRFSSIEVIEQVNVAELSASKIITASEKISRKVAEKYFPTAELVFDSYFLRYDEGNVKSVEPVNFDRRSDNSFDKEMMLLAFKEATNSSDWWRHVGAVLVKEGIVVASAYNEPVPSDHMPYLFGNPRDFIEAGTMSQFSDVLHSEKGVFAQLLIRGVSSLGASLYTSVFPCPDCAKLIAFAGIKKCYFGSGHASLDGERVMKSKGVELIYVPVEPRV